MGRLHTVQSTGESHWVRYSRLVMWCVNGGTSSLLRFFNYASGINPYEKQPLKYKASVNIRSKLSFWGHSWRQKTSDYKNVFFIATWVPKQNTEIYMLRSCFCTPALKILLTYTHEWCTCVCPHWDVYIYHHTYMGGERGRGFFCTVILKDILEQIQGEVKLCLPH